VAGGTDTTLIPGVTLQIGGALQAGSHTITAAPSTSSVFNQMKAYLDAQVGPAGMLAKRQDEYVAISKDIATRKVKIQEHIDREMDQLRKKFIVMEQAQARAQSIMQSLTQTMATMANNK
jgi:flagellar capping protein FliD